ncbi:hypothetical protein [Streptomyces wuyuanensis]|uniref:hypothetical protein n=1 Tax=Streptomyces wuyuanensis TaxID=1196353 RepID=UPI0034239BE6
MVADPLYMARFGGKYGVMTTVSGLLFPNELDLQPFRVLLLLATPPPRSARSSSARPGVQR